MTDDLHTRVFSSAAIDVDDVGRLWAKAFFSGVAERVPLMRGIVLGRGGTGVVYRAHDESLRRDVALKVLSATDPDAARRFLAEAQILAQLAHPYIAPVYRIGVDDAGRPCFAMKLVEGQTLTHKLASLESVSLSSRVRFAVPVLVKICNAVAYAHSRGVIHCDLKPDNVMIGAFGEVTLMDWGIARTVPRENGISVVEGPRKADSRAGTLEYMAPEQGLDPASVDERSDVFGLGALLHEIILGRPPRKATGLADLLQEVSLPDAAALLLPRPLLELCARALSRDASLRPASAIAFRDELESTLEERASVDVREASAGTVIVCEGEPAREAFVIVRGVCEAWRTIGGARALLRTMGPGEVFGEAAVLDGGARTASVSAHTDVELVVVPAEEILGRIGARSFVTSLAKRFRELETRASSAEAMLTTKKD